MSETTIILGIAACLVLLPVALALTGFVIIMCGRPTPEEEAAALEPGWMQLLTEKFEAEALERERKFAAMKMPPLPSFKCSCEGGCNGKASKA